MIIQLQVGMTAMHKQLSDLFYVLSATHPEIWETFFQQQLVIISLTLHRVLDSAFTFFMPNLCLLCLPVAQ